MPHSHQRSTSCALTTGVISHTCDKIYIVFIFSVFNYSKVNVIHTTNPVEHANNAMVQPNFINPVHHASVDLSGHNLVNAHQASGTAACEVSGSKNNFLLSFASYKPTNIIKLVLCLIAVEKCSASSGSSIPQG